MSTGNPQDNPTAGEQMHSLWGEITELRDKLKVWQQIAESAEHRAMVAADEIERLRSALETIEKWGVPFVESRGEAVSMSVAYGSSGVRDYFRGVAHAALQGEPKC